MRTKNDKTRQAMKYPRNLRNYFINSAKIWYIFLFSRSKLREFISKQVDFQYSSAINEHTRPENIQDWWADGFQNATIDFSSTQIRQSANQLNRSGNHVSPKNSEYIHARLAHVINHIYIHGAKNTYCVDTIEAARTNPKYAIFAKVRKKPSHNRILWPSVPHQEIGKLQFLSLHHRDKIPLSEKTPKIFWRGALHGHLESDPSFPTCQNIFNDLSDPTAPFSEEILKKLRGIPRFNLLYNYANHPYCNVGLFPKSKEKFMRNPLVSDWSKDFVSFNKQKQFRYLLSISGSDLATNFYKSLDTNSVVFKVDMPWEGFLDAQFEPWEHYIPIKADLSDLIEKYDWCESNLKACEQISKRAQERTLLAKPIWIQRKYLHQIVEKYERDFFT